MFAGVNNVSGHDAVFNDFSLMIDIFEEQIQRRDPLSQSALDLFPFRRCDNPGQQIVRKNPLRAFVISVDGKGDPLVEERLVSLVFAPSQLARTQAQKQVVKLTILFSRMLQGAEHLIVSAIEFVPAEGFCTTAIGRMRVCNHDGRTGFPCQNSASDGELLIGKSDSRH